MSDVFNDTLTGEQQLTLALLVCDLEDHVYDDRHPATEAEREERRIEGMMPIAVYIHEEGIGPEDFHRLHTRENVMNVAYGMALAVRNPEVFATPPPGTEFAGEVLRRIGLIRPWET